MQKQTLPLVFFASLLVCVSLVSAAPPWNIMNTSCSVDSWEKVSPGEEVEAYMFLGFYQDFILNQNLTFSTDLDNPTWTYSVYVTEPATFYVLWSKPEEASGNILVIPGTNDTTSFYDAVKVGVKGKVPTKMNGTDIILEKAVRYNTSTDAILDSIVINRTLTNGTAPTTPPTPIITTVATTAKPTTKKSPVEALVVLFGVIAGAALVVGCNRIRK